MVVSLAFFSCSKEEGVMQPATNYAPTAVLPAIGFGSKIVFATDRMAQGMLATKKYMS
jgi:hypothetical protein